MPIKILATVAIAVLLFTAPRTIPLSMPTTESSTSFSWLTSARAHTLTARITRITPSTPVKGQVVRIYGRGFKSRHSRHLLRLIKSRRAYNFTIRRWRDNYIEAKVPNVAPGSYLLRLMVYANGHHHSATGIRSMTVKALTYTPSRKLPRPGARRPGLPQVRGKVNLGCPDLAVVRLVPGWPSKNANGTYNFKLFAVVKNISRTTFESRRNQQQLTLKWGRRTLKTEVLSSRWAHKIVLRPGQGASIRPYYIRNYNPKPGEFAANFSAKLSYDPDVRTDGNPKNDDCRSGNNYKVLTVRELRRILSRVR